MGGEMQQVRDLDLQGAAHSDESEHPNLCNHLQLDCSGLRGNNMRTSQSRKCCNSERTTPAGMRSLAPSPHVIKTHNSLGLAMANERMIWMT